MAGIADGETVRYRRRLDRTPEKEFEKLPDSEKKLMSAMRGALENCRTRIVGMKDDLVEKEATLEAERTRRKEAEERLKQFLVDPYPSPKVNSELRQRLPRAKKSDPLLDQRDSESTEDAEDEEETTAKSKSSRTHAKSSGSPGGGVRKKKKVRRALNFQGPSANHSAKTSRDFPDGRGETSYTSTEEEEEKNLPQSKPRSSHSKGRGRHSSEYSTAPPPLFSPLHYPHYTPEGAGYQGGQYVSPFYRPLSLTPWSSMSSMPYSPLFSPREGQATPQQTRIPQSRSFPLLNGEHVSGLGPSVHFDEGAAQPTHASADSGLNSAASPHRASKPSQSAAAAESSNQTSTSAPQTSTGQKPMMPSELHSQSASSLSSHYGLPSTLRRPMEGGSTGGFQASFPNIALPLYGASPLASDLSTPYTDPSARTIAYLHEEIARLKETNKQLTESLSSKTQEIEMLKLQILAEAPNDATLDTDGARKFAELMQEVRAAEKKREETMTSRITQLEQDREQIMRDIENMPQKDNVEEKRSGRRLQLKDLSSESESDTEEEEEEEEEEEQETRKPNKRENFRPAPIPNPDAGRVASLKDALKELEKRQQRELQIYREELQVTMQQRDEALDQLQTEREECQKQQLRMPAQREQILMAKISALQREKDRADTTARQLKDEQVERHLFVSLHKALFPDSALNDNDQTTHTADTKLKAKLVDNDNDVDIMETKLKDDKEDNQLLEQLRLANQEKALLQMKCEELQAECSKEKDGKDKLERLNGVLRKKLIAVSTGTQHAQEE